MAARWLNKFLGAKPAEQREKAERAMAAEHVVQHVDHCRVTYGGVPQIVLFPRTNEDLSHAHWGLERQGVRIDMVDEQETQDMPQDMLADTEAIGHDTPLRAARRHCLSCCGGSANEVRHCPASSCALWPYRFGKRPTAADKATVNDRPVYPIERKLAGASGLRAIRRRCIDCSGNSDPAVRSCAFNDCALHLFRAGTNPFLAPRSDEWKRAGAERLASVKRSAMPKSPARTPCRRARMFWRGSYSLDKRRAEMPPPAGLRRPARCFRGAW
jgi:hypothetical protein